VVGGRVVVFSACALGLFVYALLTLAEPGALDQEADSDSPRWGLVARGGAAMAMALVFTIVAITQIDV
jgi:hypothetical protein